MAVKTSFKADDVTEIELDQHTLLTVRWRHPCSREFAKIEDNLLETNMGKLISLFLEKLEDEMQENPHGKKTR